jgi:hypothetical protein
MKSIARLLLLLCFIFSNTAAHAGEWDLQVYFVGSAVGNRTPDWASCICNDVDISTTSYSFNQSNASSLYLYASAGSIRGGGSAEGHTVSPTKAVFVFRWIHDDPSNPSLDPAPATYAPTISLGFQLRVWGEIGGPSIDSVSHAKATVQVEGEAPHSLERDVFCAADDEVPFDVNEREDKVFSDQSYQVVNDMVVVEKQFTASVEASFDGEGTTTPPSHAQIDVDWTAADLSSDGIVGERLVSGTNGPSITAKAWSSRGDVERIECLMGSETIVMYPRDGDTPPAYYVKRRLLNWDTTHFPDGTTFTAKGRFYYGHGTIDEKIGDTYRIYNKALLIGNDKSSPVQGDLDQGIAAVTAVFPIMNSVNHNSTTTVVSPKIDLLGVLDLHTVFYAWTHGDSNSFGDCWFWPFDPGSGDPFDPNHHGDAHKIYIRSVDDPTGSDGVKEAVERKKDASGKYLKPPYNLVIIDACYAAINSPGWLAAFGMASDPTDRAFVGYTTKILDDLGNALWMAEMLDHMRQGMTLSDAVQATYISRGWPVGRDSNGNLLPVPPTLDGDLEMKLHGVYQGQGLEWYRIQ